MAQTSLNPFLKKHSMTFVKKQLTLLIFIATLSFTSIHTSEEYPTISIPAPELGGTSNFIFNLVDQTQGSSNPCPHDEVQLLTENKTRLFLNNPMVIDFLKNKPQMFVVIRKSTRKELKEDQSQRFQADIRNFL